MVEIIPKPTPRPSPWKSVFLYFALFFFFGTFSVYVILDNEQKQKNSSLRELDERLTELKTEREKTLEAEISASRYKIRDFSKIFNEHLRTSKFFPLLESLTHPKVQFFTFGMNADNFEVSVSGETDSFETLGQQLIIFQQAEEIKNVKLGDVSLGKKGKIGFSFQLSFDPQIVR